MSHDDVLHARAAADGSYADEVLFEEEALTASLIHFADGSHSVRLELYDRGMALVLDTPAWLDLDTVLPEVSAAEPALSSGFAIVERQEDEGIVGYRVTIQGGDVVGSASVVLLESELMTLREALEASRERVEAADERDHVAQMPGDGTV